MSLTSRDELGLRVTAPRLAVLSVVTEGKQFTAEQVALAALERVGANPTQAVSDVLGALTRGGFVRRIEPERSPARYETRSAITTTTSCAARVARSPMSTASSVIRRA